MEFTSYLRRIGYSGPVEVSAAVLRDLHRQHMYAIPFENLDIPLGREIKLDVARIYEKMVLHGRGGFCYEQNALFAWALREIGFDVDMLSAGVARADGSFGPDFDHMLLQVRIEGTPWIVDVGFGDSFVEPLRFAIGETQVDRGLDYQVVEYDDGYVLRRSEGEVWKPQYRFTLTPRALEDYKAMCVRQQTSPDSFFAKKRVCSRATPSGRITLTENALIVTECGRKTDTRVSSVEEFERLLVEHFGMTLKGFPPVVTS